jgi:hypothetical protein
MLFCEKYIFVGYAIISVNFLENVKIKDMERLWS